MKKTIIKLIIFIFSLGIFLPIFLETANASAITETNIFNLTNSQRSKYGMVNLSWNYKLANAARTKAQDMINKDYFSHNTPSGATPWTFILNAGYNYIYAGENLAMNYSVAEDIMNAWMNSGGHRANILGENYKELGVGVVTGEFQGYTTTMVVQMFGTSATSTYNPSTPKATIPSKKSEAPSPAPQPVIDYSQTINLGTNFVKKRINDFKKAYDSLIIIIKQPKNTSFD
ncbi:MAG: CAP domain-containing protein [Candidatus Woesearchaeota archaeon]